MSLTRVFYSFVLIALLAGNAFAQKAQQILIVSPSFGPQTTALINAIKPHYGGVVTVQAKLPDTLRYDAVMAIASQFGEAMFDSVEQQRLIEYLKSGGNFYAEGGAFRDRREGASNILWDFLGDSMEAYTATVVDLTRIQGIDSEFTHGMDFADEPYENMGDAGGGFHIHDMRTLLLGDGIYSLPLAWAPHDRNIKAVLNWPIGNPQYQEFLGRVVCDDFQLCILDVKRSELAQDRLSFYPQTSTIHFPRAGEVIISDILGREAMHEFAQSDRLQLTSLPRGTYIARWTSGDHHASSTIIIR